MVLYSLVPVMSREPIIRNNSLGCSTLSNGLEYLPKKFLNLCRCCNHYYLIYLITILVYNPLRGLVRSCIHVLYLNLGSELICKVYYNFTTVMVGVSLSPLM